MIQTYGQPFFYSIFQSRDAMARGDMGGAHQAADGARTMVRISWLAGILSIVIAVVIIIIYVVVIMNRVNSYYD